MAWVRCCGSGKKAPTYIVKQGVIQTGITTAGVTPTYDSGNGRLSVPLNDTYRYIYFNCNIDIRRYSKLICKCQTAVGTRYVRYHAIIDGQSTADSTGTATTAIQTPVLSINGNTCTQVALWTNDGGSQCYVYDLWFEA